MELLRYWIWLTTIHGLSLRTQHTLIRCFGGPEEVFLADRERLEASGILSGKELDTLDRRDLRQADQVLEDCRKGGYSILTIQDAAYPQRLKAIADPPLVLYYMGTLLPFDALPAVTVVGSRNPTGYGMICAKNLGYELGASGALVVSGAAKGIDSLALKGALGAGGPVAAVLGNGLDVYYPYESKSLYLDVIDRGCLMTEYVPGTKPLGSNFPRRNRIMSGLSLAVLVVEARRNSGSLITAEFALEQGRDVYAVPGNIGIDACKGSNQLLRDGAGLVTCGWDLLENYQHEYPDCLRRAGGGPLSLTPMEKAEAADAAEEKPAEAPKSQIFDAPPVPEPKEKTIDNTENRDYIDLQKIVPELSEEEQSILECLQDGETLVDDVITGTGLSAARVLSSLTLLEVRGLVQQLPGKRFRLPGGKQSRET